MSIVTTASNTTAQPRGSEVTRFRGSNPETLEPRNPETSEPLNFAYGAVFGFTSPWWQVKHVTRPSTDSPSAGV